MIDLFLIFAATAIGYLIGGWIGALAGFLLYLPFGLWMAGEDEFHHRRAQAAVRREPGE